MPEQNI